MANALKFGLPALLAILSIVADPAQAWIAAHPAVAGVLAALAASLGVLVKSPITPKD